MTYAYILLEGMDFWTLDKIPISYKIPSALLKRIKKKHTISIKIYFYNIQVHITQHHQDTLRYKICWLYILY